MTRKGSVEFTNLRKIDIPGNIVFLDSQVWSWVFRVQSHIQYSADMHTDTHTHTHTHTRTHTHTHTHTQSIKKSKIQ